MAPDFKGWSFAKLHAHDAGRAPWCEGDSTAEVLAKVMPNKVVEAGTTPPTPEHQRHRCVAPSQESHIQETSICESCHSGFTQQIHGREAVPVCPEGGIPAPPGLVAELSGKGNYFQALRLNAVCTVGFWSCLGLVTFFFPISLCLYQCHHCILKTHDLFDFTGSQLERNFDLE